MLACALSFCGDLPRARFVSAGVCIGGCAWAAFHRRLRRVCLWEAPLFRASVLVHSRSDPHAPLCQLSAIFIHVLAEWGLQSAVTAAVPTVVGLTLLSVCFFTI